MVVGTLVDGFCFHCNNLAIKVLLEFATCPRTFHLLTLKSQSSRQGKAKGKDKKPKKGKKSASPAVTPTAGTPVPELTPEEIARQKMLERANMECTSALLSEDRSLNLKLSVVKVRLDNVLNKIFVSSIFISPNGILKCILNPDVKR